MKRPKAIKVTTHEGGEWYKPPFPLRVHTIQFEDGSTWNPINGWRKKTIPKQDTFK